MDSEILNRVQNIVSKTAKLTEYFQNSSQTKCDFDTLAEDCFIGNKRRYVNELNEFLNENM